MLGDRAVAPGHDGLYEPLRLQKPTRPAFPPPGVTTDGAAQPHLIPRPDFT